VTLQLHDTLTRRLRPVEPLERGHVRLYTCGPTVWNRAHIGNFRTFLFEDVLRRWLEHRFDRVTHVMNLTDVDDRLIGNAGAHGWSLDEETQPWITAFAEDRETLGVRPAHVYPRATRHIEDMVALIERLDAAGVTYRSDGSVYFRIAGFPRYGALSGIPAEGLVAGASGRIDDDDYAKEDARDFALWKAVGPQDIGWDTPLGRGHPGWHIECSAMSMAILGESFDIHCGGVDNIFPHHENEIAQSEAATGKPFVQIWCHAEHLTIAREKMAKRLGNFRTVPDLLAAGFRASVIRYFLITGAHYRRTLDWDEEPLRAAEEAVLRFAEFRDRVTGLGDGGGGEEVAERCRAAGTAFEEAMDDDLNVPAAMGQVFAAIRDINRLLDAGTPEPEVRLQLRGLVDEVDDVLGVLPLVDRERAGVTLTADDQDLLDRRAAARSGRAWEEADRLRTRLLERGIIVEDTAQGQRWKRR
jgi:cysteinyl-tRNA synthetase